MAKAPKQKLAAKTKPLKKSGGKLKKVALPPVESSEDLIRRLTKKTKKSSIKLTPHLQEIRDKRVYANVAITSGGACTNSIRTPSPENMHSSLALG